MKQINKNIFWNAVGNTAYNGLQWLITVIVTRRAGFGEAGILALAMSLSLTFRTVAYFGIRNFQVSDNKNRYSDGDYMGFRIITCTASVFLCMIFAAVNGYGSVQIIAIFLYMLFRISEGFSDFFQGVMQKNERLDAAGIILTVKAVLTTVFFIAGFYITGSLNAGLCFMSLSAAVVTFILEFPSAEHICGERIKIRVSNCRNLARETIPLFIYLLEASVIFNMPKYFISLSFDEAQLGAYSNIFSMALIIQAVFQYIYIPFITELSKFGHFGNASEFKRLEIKIISVLVFLTVLFSTAAHIGGLPLLTLIFGQGIAEYQNIILPTVLSVCAYSFTAFVSVIKVIKRDFRSLIVGHALGAVTGIASTLFFIDLYGLNGASFGLALASGVTVFIIILI